MNKIPKDFDWKYYLENNQDLLDAGLETESDAINHYLNYGRFENRKFMPSLPKDFDWKFYLENNQDLLDAGLKTEEDAINHYLKFGYLEQRTYKDRDKIYLNKLDIFNEIYSTVNKDLDNPKVEFRYFCFRYLDIIRRYKLPQIKIGSKYESVIVETRKFPHLEFIIRNNILKLGEDWSHTIFCAITNYDFIVDMCSGISKEIKIIKMDLDDITIPEYSEMLSSFEFWNQLVGEKILIYQEDSIIFKKNISDFLHYDYIGAPWSELNFNTENVGNGGLSLRTKEVMKKIISHITNEQTDLTHLHEKTKKILEEHSIGYKNNQIPEDVYFSINMSQLNIGILPPKSEAIKFSTESYYYKDSFAGHNFWLCDSNWKKRMYQNTIVQLKCDFETDFILHRGGWKTIIENLIKSEIENQDSEIEFYDLMEKIFLWDCDKKILNPWIGVLHSTPKKVDWATEGFFRGFLSIDYFFDNKNFIDSLKSCKMIIVLSDYVKNYLSKKLSENNLKIEIVSLKHPVVSHGIIPFNFKKYYNNTDRKLLFLGQQLRKVSNFYLLKTNQKKLWLTGTKDVNHPMTMLNEEIKFFKLDNKIDKSSVEIKYTKDFLEYDELLSENIVFIELWDGSANNAVLECIIRNTPIIINKIPPVVEYLGEDYPLYFENVDEVLELMSDTNVLKAYNYLKNMDKSEFEIDYFINELHNILYKEIHLK